ncbi:proclotting enzyme [Parasteatoda tepidariorum]|uniref:proclotting enzyme n=1 Tax=Parasteatoda tepidariorum TaxID=114398 RepID=UPI001C71F49B|nr:proclotting enzyme-like isoform X1 [Parasteatoda tepidariorum]XP_042899849.1 proclotting enzyme-like isoform X2 [Parasteatoda tepidariorum]
MQLLLLGWVFLLCFKETIQQNRYTTAGAKVIFPRSSATENTCTTLTARSGNCVALYQCRNLIEQRNLGVLRRSLCGFEGKAPKVCCPLLEDEEFTTDTPVAVKGYKSNESDILNHTSTTSTEFNTNRSTNPGSSNETQDGRRLSSPFPNDCGKTHVTFRRIVGGQESVIGAWPWMAVIYYVRRRGISAECGGVLVTNKHVVTAAHCIVSSRRGTTMRPSQLRVRLGDHNIDTTDDGADPIDISVQNIIKFDSFDLRTFQNDIAILVLRDTVTFTEHITPICIPFDVFREDDLSQRNAFVAGWGTLSYAGPSSSTLQEVQVRIWENDKCKVVFRREVPITGANLCAGDGDKDACRGDSGGPLMLAHQDGKFYLIGLVSFGKKCAEPGVPGVYTRITNFLDWIERNVENSM